MSINILLPVYNEERRLVKGVTRTIEYFKKIDYENYQLTIVDNASTDATQKLAIELSNTYPKVYYLHLNEKGVGVAIRNGVKHNNCEIVGYMDIDLSTDIRHLEQVIHIFENNASVDLVNGSRLNKQAKTIGRKWYRNITSYGLTFLLKLCLKLRASDSICGFKFFKKEVIEGLLEDAGNDTGWFLIIELLLRAERKGCQIVELPVRWKDDYNTTVHVGKQIRNYLRNIRRLRKQFKKEKIL